MMGRLGGIRAPYVISQLEREAGWLEGLELNSSDENDNGFTKRYLGNLIILTRLLCIPISVVVGAIERGINRTRDQGDQGVLGSGLENKAWFARMCSAIAW